jgi:hypothetical protein
MPSNLIDEMERTFPCEEGFVDHSGQTRPFRIVLHKGAGGDFFLYATDTSKPDGYRFEVYSTAYTFAAVGAALGDLRQKIRREIATRYLRTDAKGEKNPTHDEMRGRISCNGIVVDGELLLFKELQRILTIHEGLSISIKITTPSL